MKPGYKQTEVGVIPEEWDAGSLGRFWSVTDCKHVTADFIPDGFPVASIKEVQSRFVELINCKHTTQHFYNLLIQGGRRPKSGDLIVSRNATVGEIAQVAEWHTPFAMGQDVCLLRKNAPELSTDFMQAVFQSRIVASQFSNLMVGSTFKRANIEQIRGLSVPMPPPPEQRAIAEALSDVDGLLAGLDRLIAKKHDLKQAAMQQLLTGHTRLPGFHGEWEVKRLGDIAEMGSGGTPSSAIADYYDGDIPWVSIADMTKCGKIIMTTDRNLTRAGFSSCSAKMFPAGTVLYAMYASLGECSIAGISVCSSQAILGIRTRSGLSNEFLYYYLTSLKSVVKSLGQQGTQANLNKGMVQDFCFSLPPLPEQTAIAEILSDMDAELTALEQRREKTHALKQAMMQELLTGRTRLV